MRENWETRIAGHLKYFQFGRKFVLETEHPALLLLCLFLHVVVVLFYTGPSNSHSPKFIGFDVHGIMGHDNNIAFASWVDMEEIFNEKRVTFTSNLSSPPL